MVVADDLDLFLEVHSPISPMCGILATDMFQSKSRSAIAWSSPSHYLEARRTLIERFNFYD